MAKKQSLTIEILKKASTHGDEDHRSQSQFLNLKNPSLWMVGFFFLQGLWLAAAVPPWQNIDEPAHVEYVAQFSRSFSTLWQRNVDPDIEQAILKSMAVWNFYKWNGIFPPATTPSSFVKDPVLSAVQPKLQNPPLYYFLAGTVCKVFGVDSALGWLYVARIVSLCLGVCAVALGLTALRLAFPEATWLVEVVGGFLVLLPQFILTSVSGNNDILAVLLVTGALAWCLYRWEAYEDFAFWGGIAGVTFLALITKHTALMFLLIFPFVGMTKRNLGSRVFFRGKEALIGLGVFLVSVSIPLAIIPKLWGNWVKGFGELFFPIFGNFSFPQQGIGALLALGFKSFFGVVGWMRFPAPRDWFIQVLLLLGLSGLGWLAVLVRTFRRKSRGLPAGPWGVFWGVSLSSFGIVLFRFLSQDHALQGRFLFPILIPLVSLFVGGLYGLGGNRFGKLCCSIGLFWASGLQLYALLFFFPSCFQEPPPGGSHQESHLASMSPWAVELHAKAAHLSPGEALHARTTYQYDFGEQICDVLDIKGWYYGEGERGDRTRWSYGEGTVPFPQLWSGTAFVTATLAGLGTQDISPSPVKVSFNGREVADVNISIEPRDYTWTVTGGLVSHGRPNVLSFRPKEAKSPLSLGISSSPRPLGLQIKALTLEEAQEDSRQPVVKVMLDPIGEEVSFPGWCDLQATIVQTETPWPKKLSINLTNVLPSRTSFGTPWQLKVSSRPQDSPTLEKLDLFSVGWQSNGTVSLPVGQNYLRLSPHYAAQDLEAEGVNSVWTVTLRIFDDPEFSKGLSPYFFALTEGKPWPFSSQQFMVFLTTLVAGMYVALAGIWIAIGLDRI